MLCLRTMILVALAATALALTATAQVTTTLTFDNVPADVACDEIWQENGVDLMFTTTTAEDCDGGGNCFFGVDAGAVWLYPSRLMADLGGTYAITGVEIDIDDFCGQGCTRAFLYDGAATVASDQNAATGASTLVLVPSGGQGDRIAVSSCEGQVLEIRISTETVATEASSWSSIKGLYR
ncbi:hypothetical protein GF314_10330 [bacterium]|nr:hypothetical protein [bacterium]